MNYSQDQTQKEIAKQFSLNGSDTIFASYFGKVEKGDKDSDDNKTIEKQKQFSVSVLMAMSKALRNLGLVRDAHVSSLMLQEKNYQSEKAYLEDISSFASHSGDTILAKVFPIVGGGSAVTLT
jgi:hypothetical protein